MSTDKIAILCLSLHGGTACTAVGALAGYGVDKAIDGPYESVTIGASAVRPGQGVCVHGVQETLCGEYRGIHGPTTQDSNVYLLVERGAEVDFVAEADVRAIEVEITGHGWLYGAAAGLALDLAAVVVFEQAQSAALEDIAVPTH